MIHHAHYTIVLCTWGEKLSLVELRAYALYMHGSIYDERRSEGFPNYVRSIACHCGKREGQPNFRRFDAFDSLGRIPFAGPAGQLSYVVML